MIRRLLAALLVVAIAVPLPALAGGGCTMDVPMIAAERCDCCTAPMAAGLGGCASAAMLQAGCGCMIKADSGSQPSSNAAVPSHTASIHVALLPASVSAPQRKLRDLARAASPPGAGAAVSRPLLCTWII